MLAGCLIGIFGHQMKKSKKVSKKVTLKGGGPGKKIENKKCRVLLFSSFGWSREKNPK